MTNVQICCVQAFLGGRFSDNYEYLSSLLNDCEDIFIAYRKYNTNLTIPSACYIQLHDSIIPILPHFKGVQSIKGVSQFSLQLVCILLQSQTCGLN